MGLIETIFGAVLGKLIADDARESLHTLTNKMVRQATNKLPSEIRERFYEEWQSDIEETKSIFQKFFKAADCFRASYKILKIQREKIREVRSALVFRWIDDCGLQALDLIWIKIVLDGNIENVTPETVSMKQSVSLYNLRNFYKAIDDMIDGKESLNDRHIGLAVLKALVLDFSNLKNEISKPNDIIDKLKSYAWLWPKYVSTKFEKLKQSLASESRMG